MVFLINRLNYKGKLEQLIGFWCVFWQIVFNEKG